MNQDRRFNLSHSIVLSLVLLLSVSWLEPGATLWAQAFTANITGVVTDPTAAVIVNADVTVENELTGLQRRTKTDATGFYAFRLLPVGRYRMTAEFAGFARRILTGIEIEIDQNARMDVRLEVAGGQQEQTVLAQAPLIESASAAIGEVIENRRVTELPLNGRNFIQLALLVSGATIPPQGGTTEQWNTAGGRLGFTSNGMRDDRNVFVLDGVTMQEPSVYVVSVNPAPDAIQEFKVLQNSYSAEAGFLGGGQVNISTKSGTSEFHGTLYEFVRNDKFDAKNFFDDPKAPIPAYRQNQFGGSFGGPIQRNRTFFFGNYEGLRVINSPRNLTRLPTFNERQGDFSGIDPLTGRPYPVIFDPDTCPFNCTQFPNNRVPAGRIHSLARAVLDRMPLPNFGTSQPGFNHLNVGREPTTADQFTVRADHNLSDNHQLFGRFTFLDSEMLDDFVGNLFATNPPPPSGFGTDRNDAGKNVGVGLTSVLSPATINEFRFGYARFRGQREHRNKNSGFLDQFVPNRTPGSKNTAMPSFAIGAGFADLGDSDVFVPNQRKSDIFQFVDNVVWTKGRHTVKFGGDWRYMFHRNTVEIFSNSTFTFQDGPTAATGSLFAGRGGWAYADFLLGRPFLSFYTAGSGSDNMRLQYAGLYFNDEFRVHPRLTLTFGIREEFYTGPTDQDGEAAMIDPNNGNRFIVAAPGGQIKSSLQNDPLAQTFARQFGLQFVTNQEAGLPLSLWKPDYNNWQPRLGLAWDLFGSGRTVLRAGGGVYNGLINLGVTSDIQVPPVTYHLFGLDLGRFLTPGFRPLTYEQAFTLGNLPPFPVTYDPNIRNAYVYQWSLDLQQELTANMVLSLAYSGSHGLKLLRRAEYNQGLANLPCTGTADPAVARRINCTGPTGRRGQRLKPGGSAFYRVANGASDYHAGILKVEKRFSEGLSFTAGYTFSKAIDLASSLNESRSNATQAVDNFNLRGSERGRSDFDTPHRFIGSYLWELPFGKGKRWLQQGPASHIFGGWQTGGILNLQSGVPMTARLTFSNTGTNKGSTIERPDLAGDPNLSPSQRRPERWFNNGAFALPFTFRDAQGVYGILGNAGRNIIDGPELKNFDMSLQKTFTWAEDNALTFRADFFNLTNHPNFLNPGLLVDTPNFGVITEARSARQIQFSLRYAF